MDAKRHIETARKLCKKNQDCETHMAAKKRLQEAHDIQRLTVSEGPFTTSATGAVKLFILDRFFLNLQRQGPTLSRLYNAEVKILLCSHHL